MILPVAVVETPPCAGRKVDVGFWRVMLMIAVQRPRPKHKQPQGKIIVVEATGAGSNQQCMKVGLNVARTQI